MHVYPMKLKPILQQRVWGGRKLKEMFHKPLPDGQPYGESWEVSDVVGSPSVVANGPLAGRTLRELMETDAAGLLGAAPPAAGGRFPLLVKLLDCNEKLSVQVHPDAAAAAKIGRDARPKTESWYVLAAEPGAKIYLGLRPGVTREAFADAIDNDAVGELLNVIEPSIGDCFFIASGTVHAIGGGLLIAEVQETSDTTYRVYDWGRVGLDGRPRPLHVEEALASIHFDADAPPAPREAEETEVAKGVARKLLVDEAYARLHLTRAMQTFRIEPADRARTVQVLHGGAHVDSGGLRVDVHTGDTLLIPAGGEPIQVELVAAGIQLLTAIPGR